MLAAERAADPRARLVAIGLATVDHERAARAWPELQFEAAPQDRLLGAFAARARFGDGSCLLLLEPSTEGRLAAFLARHGEAPAAAYVVPLVSSDATGAALPTPFGPGRLANPARRSGPFVVLLADRGEPARSARPGYHARVDTSMDDVTAGSASGPAPVAIRAARADDAETIAALLTDEGYPVGPSDIVERLTRFDSPVSTVRVAEAGGEILGFVAVHVMPRFEHDDRIGRILALIVDPGARERGVGHRLMADAERIGRETGCAFLEVTAGRHRPDAQQLYEAVGYETGVSAYLRKRL